LGGVKRKRKQGSTTKKADHERVAVCIYMQAKNHRFLKAAAASRGMSLSDYVNGRLLGGGEIIVKGDFIPAPREAAPVSGDSTSSTSSTSSTPTERQK